ncbi:MAG: hypothetical protein NTX49_00095 [Chlamydiae bacterium]|nr:hypothetical protein [Chlamydiota bacterium]
MSSSLTLRIPSPVPTSQIAPATIGPALDPQSKVLQIAAVVARIALSTIATVAAFVFLPLPFAIVATATLIVANVAICFCKCTSQPRNLERSGSFNTTRIDTPPPSPSSNAPFFRGNIPQFTGDLRALPVDRTLRPEPHTAVGGGHLVQDRSPVVRFSELPAQLDTSHHPITVVYQGPAAAMPSFGFPSGSGLDMPPSSIGALASAAAPTFNSSLPQRASIEHAQLRNPQPPRTIVGGGHTSELPSLGFPSGSGLDMPPSSGGALASAAAPAFYSSLPQSASVEDAQLRNPQPPRTIVGGGHASELPSLGFPNGFGLRSTTMGGGALSSVAAPALRSHLLRRAPVEGAAGLGLLLSSRPAAAAGSASPRGAFSPPQAQAATTPALQVKLSPRFPELPPSPSSSALTRHSPGKGYRTLVGGDTGPIRRFASSLTAAKVASAPAGAAKEEELSDTESSEESLLPGAIPE